MSNRNPFDLTGQVALVTGGNSGIGLGMARAFVEAGLSGHGGLMATIHAQSADDAIARLRLLAGEAGAWLDDGQIDDNRQMRAPVCAPTGYCDLWIESMEDAR